MAQRSMGDVEPACVLSYPDTEGACEAWGGRPERASRRERSVLPSGHRAPAPAQSQTPARQTPASSGDTSRAEPSVCSCLGRGSDRKEGVVLAPR